MRKWSHARRLAIVAVVVMLIVAAGIALVSRGGDGRPQQLPAGHFEVAPAESGVARAIVERQECLPDRSVTAWIRWAAAPEASGVYLVQLTGPGIDRAPRERRSAGAPTIFGGLESGSGYEFVVLAPNGSAWAAGSFTTPLCVAYDPCSPGTNLLSNGPVSGAVTDTTAKVWLRTCQPTRFRIRYKQSERAWSQAMTTAVSTTEPSEDNTAVVTLEGLQPFTSYDYRVIVEAGISVVQPAGRLRTLPPSGQPSAFRFGLSGDIHQLSLTRNVAAIRCLRQQRPDFQLLIGDNISVDDFGPFRPSSRRDYDRMYRENFAEPTLRRLLAEVPTFSMWDDHDILNDWAQGSQAPWSEARAAYWSWVGSRNPPPLGPSVNYFTFDVGQTSFFILDVRSHRAPKSAPDDARKSMLGAEQKAHLKEWLLASPARFKFIVSGVPWNDHQVVPLKEGDGWDGFKSERKELFDYVRKNQIAGVVLLSADAHWPGVFRDERYGLYEFQLTPLASIAAPLPDGVLGAPDVIFARGQTNAFGIFEVDSTRIPAVLNLRIYDSRCAELYSITLTQPDLGDE